MTDGDTPLPAPASEAAFAPGDAIANRYRVVRYIAHGGMGDVYEVEDTLLGGRVALKTLRTHLAADDRAQERLRRELTLARRITHPNVCRLFDLGMYDGLPFFTMELLDGETLADRLAREGAMTPAQARPIAVALASALDAAHEAGVLHRDFKSANIILVADGEGLRPWSPTSASRASTSPTAPASSPARARSSAPPPTSRPSRSRASRSPRAPTCTPSASSSSRC